MECLKCQAEGSIFLRKKDFYCNNCLILNVNHKFRASIGKRKILKTHEKVLIALSSSMSSLVMLDMISNSINLETHKKLRISAVCLHVIGKYSVSIIITNFHKNENLNIKIDSVSFIFVSFAE